MVLHRTTYGLAKSGQEQEENVCAYQLIGSNMTGAWQLAFTEHVCHTPLRASHLPLGRVGELLTDVCTVQFVVDLSYI